MKAPAFLEFIPEINQLDHHQRTVLAKTLNQLEDEPKVYDLIEAIFVSAINFRGTRNFHEIFLQSAVQEKAV